MLTWKSKYLGAFNLVFQCHNCHTPLMLIVQAFLYTFSATNITDFPWHFRDIHTIILGCQTCVFWDCNHVFPSDMPKAHFYYFLDYNSIYSGLPNVFCWGCNALFSERCAKRVFLGLQCMFFSEWYTILIHFQSIIPYILRCQTCFTGVAMRVFLSDVPNVFL